MERAYRRTINRIAWALLLFAALGYVQSALLSVLGVFTGFLMPVAGEVVYECVGGLLYALQFCLPVLLYRRLSPDCAPMFLRCKLPRESLLYVFFGVALVSAAAYLNSFMVRLFDYGTFSSEVLWDLDASTNYQLVLMFLTLVVIPAFVEELLFRGLVLGHLLPYGKTTAIFVSAILFGLMHRNIEQLFYATAAGLVLGWVFVRTRSIWPCVLLHFFNNFQTVISTAVGERLPATRANLILSVIEGGIFLLGILSGIWLFLAQKPQTDAEKCDCEGEAELSTAARVRGFFTAPMIAFCVLCIIEMGLLLLLSQLYLK